MARRQPCVLMGELLYTSKRIKSFSASVLNRRQTQRKGHLRNECLRQVKETRTSLNVPTEWKSVRGASVAGGQIEATQSLWPGYQTMPHQDKWPV